MDKHGLHPQRIGDAAGVLPARSAETGQRIGRHIVPARDADLADGIGHGIDRDFEEALRDLFQRFGLLQRGGDLFQPRPRSLGV